MPNDILSGSVNRRIGQAMHTYQMLQDGDRVLVAVSGGIDSLVAAWVLNFWKSKAPIQYDIRLVHIDMEASVPAPMSRFSAIAGQLDTIGLKISREKAQWNIADIEYSNKEKIPAKDACFQCARNRRNQLFALAEQAQYTKIAFGHHKDDIIETFFLNLLYSGNISTMRPRQNLFSGKLSLIRPLAFLEKYEISTIGRRLGINAVSSTCPIDGHTRRTRIRRMLTLLYRCIPGSKASIFAALGNVRHDYLLKQINH